MSLVRVLLRLYPALIPVLLCGFSSDASHEDIIKVSAALTDSLRERKRERESRQRRKRKQTHREACREIASSFMLQSSQV